MSKTIKYSKPKKLFISNLRSIVSTVGELCRSPISSLLTICIISITVALPSFIYINYKQIKSIEPFINKDTSIVFYSWRYIVCYTNIICFSWHKQCVLLLTHTLCASLDKSIVFLLRYNHCYSWHKHVVVHLT